MAATQLSQGLNTTKSAINDSRPVSMKRNTPFGHSLTELNRLDAEEELIEKKSPAKYFLINKN